MRIFIILNQFCEQPTIHLTRQAVSETTSERNVSSNPEIIAPITLVAANVIPKRTIDTSIAPSIAIKSTERILHTHSLALPRIFVLVIRVIARYTTAIPRTTHKNAGVTVIVAVKVKNAVIIPMMIAATMLMPRQLHLHPQLQFEQVMFFTSNVIICRTIFEGERNYPRRVRRTSPTFSDIKFTHDRRVVVKRRPLHSKKDMQSISFLYIHCFFYSLRKLVGT